MALPQLSQLEQHLAICFIQKLELANKKLKKEIPCMNGVESENKFEGDFFKSLLILNACDVIRLIAAWTEMILC